MKVQIWELIRGGGGITILVKECFEIKILDISIRDRLVTKVLLNGSKFY